MIWFILDLRLRLNFLSWYFCILRLNFDKIGILAYKLCKLQLEIFIELDKITLTRSLFGLEFSQSEEIPSNLTQPCTLEIPAVPSSSVGIYWKMSFIELDKEYNHNSSHQNSTV